MLLALSHVSHSAGAQALSIHSKKISQTMKCSHTANLGRAKPWEYWHSDKNGTGQGKPTAHKRLLFLHTIVALTYTFRKRIFLAWDECERGAEKTTSTLRTEKQATMRLFDVMKYYSESTAVDRKRYNLSFYGEVSVSRKSVYLTGMCINTHLCLPRPTPLLWPHHQ